MASLSRHFHPESNIEWIPLQRAMSDAGLSSEADAMMALCLTDPDGERHIYPFDENGKQVLLKALTGGVIVPTPGEVIQQ